MNELKIRREKMIAAVNLIFDSFEKNQVDDLTAFCVIRVIQKQLEERLGFKVEVESGSDH